MAKTQHKGRVLYIQLIEWVEYNCSFNSPIATHVEMVSSSDKVKCPIANCRKPRGVNHL